MLGPRPEQNPSMSITPHQYRPRIIYPPNMTYENKLGLFGTCGSPESTWRQDFIKMCEQNNIGYYNPQKAGNTWTPEDAKPEAHHFARDKVLIIPVSKETHGYASLAECGFAMLSALLRGQDLAIYIEEDQNMPEAAVRARRLFVSLSETLLSDYPICKYVESMKDLLRWTKYKVEESLNPRSKIKSERTIKLTHDAANDLDTIGLFGSNEKSGVGSKTEVKRFLQSSGTEYYDPDSTDWDPNNTDMLNAERDVKLRAKTIVQVISAESESFGSLAESGLLALSAFLRGATYCLLLEPHSGDPKGASNRARDLVREHVGKLNEQFPNLIFMTDNVEVLKEYIDSLNIKGRQA